MMKEFLKFSHMFHLEYLVNSTGANSKVSVVYISDNEIHDAPEKHIVGMRLRISSLHFSTKGVPVFLQGEKHVFFFPPEASIVIMRDYFTVSV